MSDYSDSLQCGWRISSDKDWSIINISFAMVFIKSVFVADRLYQVSGLFGFVASGDHLFCVLFYLAKVCFKSICSCISFYFN